MTPVNTHWLAGNRPKIMAVLNLTPDSFSDGGQFGGLDAALKRVEQMCHEGADIIDLGGESTRPGATTPGVQEEIDRVVPVLEQIKQRFDIAVSVDTSNAALMKLAIANGVDLINDVRALLQLDAFDFLANSSVDICLMHMQGQPGTMQKNPVYGDVVADVCSFLQARIESCVMQGIDRSRLLVDPGFGFGKSLQHNLVLLNRLDALKALGCPVLIGTSRKSMIGAVLDKAVDERLYGSLSTVVLAVNKGARVIRVHDVRASREVVDMAWAVINEKF